MHYFVIQPFLIKEIKQYVLKQKCTTANIVIYSVVSLFYSQKFFC